MKIKSLKTPYFHVFFTIWRKESLDQDVNVREG